MKYVDKKEVKTMVAPILATVFIVLNMFGIDVDIVQQSEILLGVTNLIVLMFIVYGIWHSHDKKKSESK